MKTRLAIKINELNNYNKANFAIYQWLISKLIYSVYKTRSNIAFVGRRLSKYNANLQKSHLKAVKYIICYFKQTMHFELVYKHCFDKSLLISQTLYRLIRLRDKNFAKDLKNQKLMIRYCFFFNGIIVL